MRKLLVLTISAVALTIPGMVHAKEDDKSANPEGSPVIREQVIQQPVNWTLTTTACPLLTTNITGSGMGRKTITLVRNPQGTFNYKINQEVSGTATDANSHHYIFLYVNTAFVDSGTGFPLPQAPYDTYGTDEFRLIPVDGGTAFTTNIFFKLRIHANGSFTDLGSLFSPNAFCDPI